MSIVSPKSATRRFLHSLRIGPVAPHSLPRLQNVPIVPISLRYQGGKMERVIDYSAQPTLHTMVKDATVSAPQDVRYLLIHVPQGPKSAALQQYVSGTVTEIASGTEYEMDQRAVAVMEEWGRDGFRPQREREPVYEPLERTLTLAALMGYQVIYDPEFRDMRRGNFTGAVALAQWSGRQGKNGGGYAYAFTGNTIIAAPTLPPGHGINLAPTSAEFVRTMQQALALQKTVGPFVELVLG